MDRGILKLVAKRARFLASLVEAKNFDPKSEKEIRMSWENNAAKFCKDPKASRDLFLLVQDIEAISELSADMPHFNLCPAPKPVQIELHAPACAHLARYYFVLAGISGQETSMRNIPLTDSIIDGLKAINILGGNLWYENDGSVFSRPSKGLVRGSDIALHIGKDKLNMWLCLALCLGLPYHIKISGENELRQIDFEPLAKFLPKLGARFVQVIPSQTGLPIRIEASGVTPEEVLIPSDLPMEFVLALLLAANFWDAPIRFDLSEFINSLQDDAQKSFMWQQELEELSKVLENCQIPLVQENNMFYCSPKDPVLPQECAIPSDAEISTFFLLFPALTSGYVKLNGLWPLEGKQSMIKPIMDFAGLDFSIEESFATSKGISDSPANADDFSSIACTTALKTLLFLIYHQKTDQDELKISKSLQEEFNFTANDYANAVNFLELLGYDENMNRADPTSSAFTAPSADWAMAFSMAAYYKPRIQLVNPNIMNDYYPFYWRLYNTLPKPELKKQEKKSEESSKKRIIAKGAFAQNLPEFKYDNDEE